MQRLRLRVRGAVQGVGFRWFVREAAQRSGVDGWVRNREDGSVEIAVGGPDAMVERFVTEVERGPRGAWVQTVTRDPLGDDEELSSPFAIRH